MTALLNSVLPAYTLGQPGALQIRGLNKHYQIDGKPLQVLKDIDLQVLPGEFVCIVGASGCGKSSLLRLIVGLEQDYAGHIHLDGERVQGTSLDRGLVFQDHRLFPWKTVEQNVALALKPLRLGKREKPNGSPSIWRWSACKASSTPTRTNSPAGWPNAQPLPGR